METVQYSDFSRIEIRSGIITRAEAFPKANKPAYKLWIDFGAFGVKQSSAQISKLYSLEELVGRQVLAVANFPPKQVADFISEVLVLGTVLDSGEVVLIQPDRPVPPGMRVS